MQNERLTLANVKSPQEFFAAKLNPDDRLLVYFSGHGFHRPDSGKERGYLALIVFCYLSMVLGMIAQYFYVQAERGNRTFQFDWMTFLMPIFASPIVFIPLLTLTSEVAMGGAFTRAKLMVYLVAFQNGFFWKGFFEQRRSDTNAAAAREMAAMLSPPSIS